MSNFFHPSHSHFAFLLSGSSRGRDVVHVLLLRPASPLLRGPLRKEARQDVADQEKGCVNCDGK